MSLLLVSTLLTSLIVDQPKVSQSDFKFLSGTWTAKIWGGDFEEVWSTPKGNIVMQMGRHVKDGKLTFMEFGSIEQSSDGNWMMHLVFDKFGKGDKKPVGFKLTTAKKGDLLFVNPTNDFPTHIRYTSKSKNEFNCMIYGRSDGQEQKETFKFIRSK